jgi:hypothetical protein
MTYRDVLGAWGPRESKAREFQKIPQTLPRHDEIQANALASCNEQREKYTSKSKGTSI